MVDDKWSACSASTPTIQSRIPLKPRYSFSVKFVLETNENKKRGDRDWPPFKKLRAYCKTESIKKLIKSLNGPSSASSKP